MSDEPQKNKGMSVTRDLTNLSLHELADYKSELESEIIRVDLEVGKKTHDKASAEALFQKKES